MSCATPRVVGPKPVPAPLTQKPFATPAPDRELETLSLPVDGFLPAVLVLPATTTPRPLLVVAHGAGDKPEWQCEWWSAALGSRAVVLVGQDPASQVYVRGKVKACACLLYTSPSPRD